MTFVTERLTLAEFAARVQRFNWQRKITAVHLHHTWKPNHSHWTGAATVIGMYKYHTTPSKWIVNEDGKRVNVGGNGWADIAQHISVAPDGGLWTGRDWNAVPVSSTGHNGTKAAGPFMFEIIGNFDKPPAGMDRFTGPQRIATLGATAYLAMWHRIPPRECVRFHRQLGSPKSCPGTGIDYEAIVEDVDLAHAALTLMVMR